MNTPVSVTFEPSGAVAHVEPGTLVVEAAEAAGVLIPAPCGRRGVCGSCGVRVLSGTLDAPDETEASALRRAPNGVRLACRARVEGPVVLKPLFAASLDASHEAQAGEYAGSELVAAIDLGTTTVAAAIAGAAGGALLGSASAPNQQQAVGADVLSRISAAVTGGGGALQEQARSSAASVLSRARGTEAAQFARVVIAGNSAMAGLLAGADMASLATHPFKEPEYQVGQSGAWLPGSTPDTTVILVPPVASFVGGDVLAGLAYTGMLHAGRPEVLVDLGTNAEVALMADGRLWVASAAAGPAFEGGGIECGMQAAEGAVVGSELVDGDLKLGTIGERPPVGIAGSGLVSLAATLVGCSHLRSDGRLEPHGPLAQRFAVGEDGVLRMRLDAEGAVVLSQLDIRALQLAKAAVATGVRAVLWAAGVSAVDVAAIHVAGAFGSGLGINDLGSLGVLPLGALGVADVVGNASLSGALAFALEPGLLEDAIARAREAVHVDLATSPEFNQELLRATELVPYDV